MKSKIILLLATLFFGDGTTVFAQTTNKNDNNVYDVVEQMPSFPGGPDSLHKYLTRHIIYPISKIADKNGVQKRVGISFIIERNGSLSNIKVIRPDNLSLDEEAIRIIKAMPKWQPGKKNGSTVRVKFSTTVTFRMQ